MDYKKIYSSLVEKAKVRGLDKSKCEGYFEIHHIIPRCVGGLDDDTNLVMFTGREHYLAHILLWKIYPEDKGLFHAAWMMSNKSFMKHKSRVYETLKIKHAAVLSSRSAFNSPNFKDLTGHRAERLEVIEFAGWSSEVKGKRTSLWSCQCDCGEVVVLKARFLNGKGAYKSCGCYKMDQLKASTGEKNPFFGKTHSEDAKAKMAAKKIGKSPSNKGVPMTEERRQRVIAALAKIERFPWTHPMVASDDNKLSMWAVADFFYELYKKNTELSPAKLCTLYNKLYNDNLKVHSLNTFHREFTGGWIPTEDEKWVEFSRKHLEVGIG